MDFMYFFQSFYLIIVLNSNTYKTETIKTSSGTVQGHTLNILGQQIEEYLGIPFAEPPVGNLRFGKPKPLEKPIEGIIDATVPKKSCPQIKVLNWRLTKKFNIEEMGEDCLVLNIWCPQNKIESKLKPVMFMIYGGALIIGSIFQRMNNASVLATHDVCVVAANYRIGQFGFLYGGDESAPGNVGFYDQLLALQWVRENIHLFGGDKNQITIFGWSAGSWSVSALLLSPLAKGLFKRAILVSGAHMYNKDRPVLSKEEALLKAKELAKNFKCEDNDKWLQCLRAQDVNNLRWFGLDVVYPVDGTEYLPLLAQNAIKQGKFNKDLDLLAGFTKDEGTVLKYLAEKDLLHFPDLTEEYFNNYLDKLNNIYHNIDVRKVSKFYLNNTDLGNSSALMRAIDDLSGDIGMKCPTYLFAKLYAQHSSPETNVYVYEFAHISDNFPKEIRAAHGSDWPLILGHPLVEPSSAVDIEFSKEYMKLFTDFAKNGKPDPQWPRLVGMGALPGIDMIKRIHSEQNMTIILSDLFKDDCNGAWKDYF